jgi:hypothetical protein
LPCWPSPGEAGPSTSAAAHRGRRTGPSVSETATAGAQRCWTLRAPGLRPVRGVWRHRRVVAPDHRVARHARVGVGRRADLRRRSGIVAYDREPAVSAHADRRRQWTTATPAPAWPARWRS